MSTDYGQDVSTNPDLDPLFGWISGSAAVGQAVARRLQTPRGALVSAPNYGYDVRGLLNASIGPSDTITIAAEIVSEVEKDERVLGATATVTFDAARMTLSISLSIELATGPFPLVLAIDRVSVSIVTGG